MEGGAQPPPEEPTVVEYVRVDYLAATTVEEFVSAVYGDAGVTADAVETGDGDLARRQHYRA